MCEPQCEQIVADVASIANIVFLSLVDPAILKANNSCKWPEKSKHQWT